MNNKIMFLSILIFFILRDQGCPVSPSEKDILLEPVSGTIVNSQNVPVSQVKVISIYADTLPYKQRLDSAFTIKDGSYTMKQGLPTIQEISGSSACDNGEHTVTCTKANFLLVFIHSDYDTTIASIQNYVGDTPANSLSRKIDTIILYSYYNLSYCSETTINLPSIILKSHHP
jgi:hypothetical protein